MAGETPAALREQVRERYAQAARTVLDTASAGPGGCCGSAAGGSCCDTGSGVVEEEGSCGRFYEPGELDGLPAEAVLASMGCGNPFAVADLREGERVFTRTYARIAPAFIAAQLIGGGIGALLAVLTHPIPAPARAQVDQAARLAG